MTFPHPVPSDVDAESFGELLLDCSDPPRPLITIPPMAGLVPSSRTPVGALGTIDISDSAAAMVLGWTDYGSYARPDAHGRRTAAPPAREVPPSVCVRARCRDRGGVRLAEGLAAGAGPEPALGLSMVKPSFSIVSTKSMDAPIR